MTDVTITKGGTGEHEEVLPFFQLAVLHAISRAPSQEATIRDLTEEATELFRKRLDTAQVHIALGRLKTKNGGLVIEVTPRTVPRRYTITAAGKSALDHTFAIVRRMVDADTTTAHQKAPADGKHRRPGKNVPARTLR